MIPIKRGCDHRYYVTSRTRGKIYVETYNGYYIFLEEADADYFVDENYGI